MTTFPIDPKALEAAAIAASTEETRYYLNGVHLTKTPDRPDEVCYEATDGHRLFRTWAEPRKDAKPVGEVNAIIPTTAVRRIVAYAKEYLFGHKTLEATVADGRIRVTLADDVVVDTRLIDGKFPDTQRVIPNLKTDRVVPGELGFDLGLLESIGKAVRLINGDAVAVVRLNDPSSPAVFEAPNFLAVLMPCRL